MAGILIKLIPDIRIYTNTSIYMHQLYNALEISDSEVRSKL